LTPEVIFFDLVLVSPVLCRRSELNGVEGNIARCFWGTRVYEITNPKHQITNKLQITISNDQNRLENSNLGHFDFSSIDEKIFFNSFASRIRPWASSAVSRLFVS
jgi:hypothetical protein